MSATEYLKRVANALPLAPEHIYGGEKGAKRLAREVGWCLQESPEEEALKAIGDSYNYVCVIGYNLNPPLDKKDWDTEVYNKYKEVTE